jgi:hypothetical protein
MVDGSAFRGTDASFGGNLIKRIYQREVRVYTVVQTETDGRQATITITAETDRVIDGDTGRTIETSNPRVRAEASNTGTVRFSANDLRTMENVTTDIVDVALTNGYNPQVFLAQAQKETHLGVGAFGDRASNRGKPEMGGAVNPIQVDGAVNGGNFASPTDRKGNLLIGMRQLYNEYPNSRDISERLAHYNAGGNLAAGSGYATDVIKKMQNINLSIRYASGRYDYFSKRVIYPSVY